MNRSAINSLLTLLLCTCPLLAQSKNVVIKNNSPKEIVDYMVELPVDELKLQLNNYVGVFPNGAIVPIEVSSDIKGEVFAILPVDKIAPGEEISIKIEQGVANSYPKRAYAELSHKIGGEFEGNKYVGGYSWVKPNHITLPGSFRDHSYYIKYEGPGWENDKVAFRYYLDNRNAIDVYGKKTPEIVLPGVGIDGYSNYHEMSDWGMDNLKVGKALGIGSIAYWDGTKANRVEKRDSTTATITADGKLRSQVETTYYGWDANGEKYDLLSLITLDAGSRASKMELLVDKSIDNLSTGIIKMKNTEYIVSNEPNSKWSYIATFGQQSLNKDMQGLVIFAKTDKIKQITEDELNYVVVLEPDNGYAEYYFMPTWELDPEPVADKETLIVKINEVLDRLNNPVSVKIKK